MNTSIAVCILVLHEFLTRVFLRVFLYPSSLEVNQMCRELKHLERFQMSLCSNGPIILFS